jgi:hypothetical protein
VVLIELIRNLPRRVGVPGIELGVKGEVGLIDRIELAPVRIVEPRLVFLDRSADVDVYVVVLQYLVTARTEAEATF